MRGIGIPLLLLLVCGVVAGQVPPEEAARAAARSNSTFAADLYSALSSRDGNLFFSPYSVSTALAMTRQGAKGETAAQIDRVFHWEPAVTAADHVALAKALSPGSVRDGYGKTARDVPAHEIHIANALWAQEGLAVEKPFAAVLEDEFGAPLRRLDFGQSEKAREVINAWVAEQTKKRIQNIVPEGLPTPDTLLTLANAIWFKAAWHQPFQERFTKEAPFHTADGREVSVPLMYRRADFRYAEDDAVQVLEIDYRGHETSMVVVLPKANDGLADVEASLDAEKLGGWISSLAGKHVTVALPKFEITCPLEVTRTLAAMGMSDAFDGRRADFTGMTAKRPLFIGAVLHKAFVKVDEAGTEAAAATVVTMRKGGEASKPVEFVADHPFLFLIRHRATGCVLFVGRVADPTK